MLFQNQPFWYNLYRKTFQGITDEVKFLLLLPLGHVIEYFHPYTPLYPHLIQEYGTWFSYCAPALHITLFKWRPISLTF
jgi:hypothetical protein